MDQVTPSAEADLCRHSADAAATSSPEHEDERPDDPQYRQYPIGNYRKIVRMFGTDTLDEISKHVGDSITEDPDMDGPTAEDLLASIEQNDLSGFEWAPVDEQGIRFFVSRFAPQHIIEAVLEMNMEDFKGFTGACDVRSPWNWLLVLMVAAARRGAVCAYSLKAEDKTVPDGRPGTP